ncbi:MAG: hypothetical protein KFB93_04540 [Simkaniaceae bacterium]|jgi:hypothetical protein|nr:MAG: hypothetical protein KFB93_04540 [Simkaniaceae bacterium]
MSTNMQTTTNPNPEPSATTSTGLGGLCLSSGVEGSVTSALCYLQQVLCDINYQDLLQSEEMAVTNKDATEAAAENTIEEGQEMFTKSLAQGIGTITGSFVSLGAMAYGEYSDPSKADLEQIKQQKEGIQNYKSALPEEHRVNINEKDGLQVETELDTGKQEITPDQKEAVQKRTEELKKQKSFVDQDGKALQVSDEDKTLLSTLDETPIKELNEALDKQYDKLTEQEQTIANKHSARVQTFATVGKSIGDVFSGIGTTIGAFAEKAAAEYRADAQLASSAAQSMGSIMAQMLKTANDALSQAQQTIQNMATISNGNRFQG